MRTVIIEHQETFALDLKRWLEQSGCLVLHTANSFVSAVEILMTERGIDVAFIALGLDDDAQIPSGAMLVDLASSRAIPVVVVSNSLTPIPDQLKGVGLLTKPFSGEQVATVLASIPKRRDFPSLPSGERHIMPRANM
jgi:CheY-like chemotaxis protein